MSGYCRDCGNTMCVCDDLKDQEITIEQGFSLTIDLLKMKNREIEKLKELFLAAKNYIDESPCDPDIYPEQYKAWVKYQDSLRQYNELMGEENV